MRAGDIDRQMRTAYGRAAAAWARGPERVYRHLAAALVDAAPTPLRGMLLLDVGAGTGVLGDIAAAHGARCVETDAAAAMLRESRPDRRRIAVAADGRRLPFAAATFDAATAGCSLSHVDEPAAMLTELHRVLRADGMVLVSAFPASGASHPVRDCVEGALADVGYAQSDWYRHLTTIGERRVDSPGALHALAAAAGFGEVRVHLATVDTGISDPQVLVDYRLGVAQHTEFLATLDPATRKRARSRAIAALGPTPPVLRVDLLMLVARA